MTEILIKENGKDRRFEIYKMKSCKGDLVSKYLGKNKLFIINDFITSDDIDTIKTSHYDRKQDTYICTMKGRTVTKYAWGKREFGVGDMGMTSIICRVPNDKTYNKLYLDNTDPEYVTGLLNNSSEIQYYNKILGESYVKFNEENDFIAVPNIMSYPVLDTNNNERIVFSIYLKDRSIRSIFDLSSIDTDKLNNIIDRENMANAYDGLCYWY